ncbi:methionyl-tRNA formyltransferase [Spiroplasma diminutum CUAS-1]|uniref:Methionyl-tRNA formyltransferase n=2 Tax=Spiroplasma diminutum TaxID=216936 RepID=S5ME57_9MOLU|nr:methionyl-tRNA formyltransferase [Spiroplasma diminutum]AGR42008.1 methionyl-tRNA formyltransferase [Spiroplasma diminutum CUAS-1]
MYKVIFCGTPQISVEILKGLENIGVEIVGIVTQPDKQVGRKKEIIFSPVKEYALLKGYSLFQPYKIGEIKEELEKLNANFMVTCAYGQFITQPILDLFENCINVHASLLPKYRGGSPIQFAIMNGESKTGISLMKMIKKMDAGEVYCQEEIEISENDNAQTLFEKMALLGKKMIEENILDIFNGKVKGIIQNENEVTFAYNLKNEQENINWNKSAYEINNFIRALSPQPIAFTYINNERIKIKSARIIKDNENFISTDMIFKNGEIVSTDKEGIIVNTSNGYLKILELQREGKKMVNASSFNDPNSSIKSGVIFSNEKITE